LSPTAVLERVKRLARDGYILGYEARLNPLKLGAGMMVFVESAAGPHHARRDRHLSRLRCRCHHEIMECHIVAGGFDYLLKTRVADMAAYRQFIGQRICGNCRVCARRAPTW
jgi:Lrp/AsnC family leucine-responsive transcriptional regulator